MDFKSARELLELCEKHKMRISDVMRRREIEEGETTGEACDARMKKAYKIMGESARGSIEKPGKSMGGLLGGAVVTESIFSWPGVGRLMMNSISKRDYPMIQGITLMLCISYLLVNLFIDIVYAWVDPRIRLDKKS